MKPINENLYDSFYYTNHGKTIANSIDPIVSLAISIVNPRSVVDIGCAQGSMLSYFKFKGIDDILGIDGFWIDEGELLINKDEFFRFDLNEGFLELPKRYDLAISTEVAEHIYEHKADEFIATLVGASDIILFSAAIPGQGGLNHVNEQWPQYWIEKFNKHDYLVFDCIRGKIWNTNDVEFWYKQNLLLFCKKDSVSTISIPDTEYPKYDVVHPDLFQRVLRYPNREDVWQAESFVQEGT